jgi:hypothetical protein
MAEDEPELRDRQPWKAAYERDYGWLGAVLAEHYAGDDTNVRTLLAGVLAAHSGISVDDFEAQADSFLRTVQHPTLGRGAGNSNGDIPMLDFTQHPDKPVLRLLVLHDDAEREFDYTSGAEQALEKADTSGWTVVSIKNDWDTVF